MDYSSLSDIDLLALCVWREARGEGPIGQRGVAHTIQNRAAEPSWWGHDVRGVILCPRQFSSFNADDPNADKFPNPADQGYQSIDAMCRAVLGGTDEDVTAGAQWYIDSSISPPAWASKLEVSLQIGRLTFYRKPRLLVTDPDLMM